MGNYRLTEPWICTEENQDRRTTRREVSDAEQEDSLSKAQVRHDGAWSPHGWLTVTSVVTTWMGTVTSVVTTGMADRYECGHHMDGDRYECGHHMDGGPLRARHCTRLTFLHSQILCRLYKSLSDETINRGPPCVYTHAKRPHTHVKDPVVHWIMETPK